MRTSHRSCSRGRLGTNNIESSTRLFGASAMAGLQGSFGLDGSIGCYEDIDHADVLVLWDVNLAETDPVLYSRMLERKRIDPAVRIIDLSTRTTRTSYAADHSLLHVPHAALAIANAICYEIVARKWVHREFVTDHVAFKRGKTDIGYGLTDGALVEEVATDATWNEYVAFLADYTPERVQELSGLSAASIRWLASIYGDPQRKVMSVWGRQVNQDVRGTWLNNALYNIHLLVGKVASPGNSPFATTGQPSGGCAVHDAGTLTGTLPRGEWSRTRRTASARPRSGACRWNGSIPGRPGLPSRCSAGWSRGRSASSGSWPRTRWSACPTWIATGRRPPEERPLHRRVGGLSHPHHRRGGRRPSRGDVAGARGHLRQCRAARPVLPAARRRRRATRPATPGS